MTNTDLTSITNEGQKNLKERFRVLIRDTKFFECLVGFFYSENFWQAGSNFVIVFNWSVILGKD